jgi:hypothetical protein
MAILVHSIKNPFCDCEGNKCVIRPKDSMVSRAIEEHTTPFLWEKASGSHCMDKHFPDLNTVGRIFLLKLFTYKGQLMRISKTTRGLDRDKFFRQLKSFGLVLSPKPELIEGGGPFRKRYKGAGIHIQLKVFFADELYTDNKPGLIATDPKKKLYFLLNDRPTKPVGTDTDKSFLDFVGNLLNDILVLEDTDESKEFIWFDFDTGEFKKSESLPETEIPLRDFLKAKEISSSHPQIPKGSIFA